MTPSRRKPLISLTKRPRKVENMFNIQFPFPMPETFTGPAHEAIAPAREAGTRHKLVRLAAAAGLLLGANAASAEAAPAGVDRDLLAAIEDAISADPKIKGVCQGLAMAPAVTNEGTINVAYPVNEGVTEAQLKAAVQACLDWDYARSSDPTKKNALVVPMTVTEIELTGTGLRFTVKPNVQKDAAIDASIGGVLGQVFGVTEAAASLPPAGAEATDPAPLLSEAERAELAGYCEAIVDQALQSELTPETAPLLFDAKGELIPERKTRLAYEYMEGLTEACETNVLAYSLKPAKEGGAPVMVIERFGDDVALDHVDRRIIADLKACVGDVGTEYGAKGTKTGVLPNAIRQRISTKLLDGCKDRYELDMREAEANRRITEADRRIAEAEDRRKAAEDRISARTDEIIASFKADNSI